MVGRSRGMKEVFKTIGLVAKSPATVLVTGESGTGKELAARAIHNAGEHPDGPFVVINCAVLVETLLESDMFGHERGAFTGAVSKQAGKFTLARGGTIFLDEISELSPSMQAKLLRVLRYKEFRRVALALVNSAGCVLRRRDSGNGDNLFCAADVLRSQRRSTQRSATAPTNNSTACRIALCI